jgi:hypothetical protein
MFILIFVNLKQINYKMCIWDYLSFDSYILSTKKMIKNKKTYMINHIPIK